MHYILALIGGRPASRCDRRLPPPASIGSIAVARRRIGWMRIRGTQAFTIAAAALVALAACSPAPRGLSHSSETTAVVAAGKARTLFPGYVPASNGRVTAVDRRTALAEASRLLRSALVPPGSRAVAYLPGHALSGPAQLIACSELEEATRLWITTQAPAATTAFLTGHVPAGMFNEVQGGSTSAGRSTSFIVTDAPMARRGDAMWFGPAHAELVFTFASLGGRTGLRVDAVTVPEGASCLGGAA
jgi:hypothetical protein